MCAIAGKIIFKGTAISEGDIGAMNDAMAHRGPDGHGVFISRDGKVGLGHRRLSVIDLSPLGRQPMYCPGQGNRRYWIVYNGEIYNYRQQRANLEKDGYSFHSDTDTEVIPALYDKFGVGCLEHLRGMFSFAIYDEKRRTLFCARDRVGKKPFKYFLNNNVFIFASELKAILTQDEYHREPDYEAIHHYLTYQYVPSPLTGFMGIQKLEPAHYLLIEIDTMKITKKRYWSLDYSQKLEQTRRQWGAAIMEKLTESVGIRMRSDVPLGALLSGGVDSSAITALMSRVSSKPIRTFSVGFEEDKFSELRYAKIIANKFKTDHTELIVTPLNAEEILPHLAHMYEEPYADSSALPSYYVSKLTREHVTVALNGDGGDENFAGYDRYAVHKFAVNYGALLPNKLLRQISRFLSGRIKTTLVNRLERFITTLPDDAARRYVNYICYFTNAMKHTLYSDKFAARMAGKDSYALIENRFREAGTRNLLDAALYTDFMTYLPDDLMVKMDIAAMAVSLEGRSPFLDHEFLELTAKIPYSLKLKGLNNKKYILKKALLTLLPKAVMYRPKMGFAVPLDVWFRTRLKNYARAVLLSDKAVGRGMFKKDAVKALLDEPRINWGYHLWALLMLELWFREFFD
ncbi:asparagine synthase (glutamine-hydrolyzing) [Candidatus Magnetominusculus xianensis]|uniref:asparagine synthase (glutamine-hydrolyzing) n=1 Tax=Candidatus Magnetominusculus xianensis TaxID=1748249 RepID=A0ABR5SBQ7_9BACT|nr:asparagine synthase (glutamine-hydrolyzing) [Candidatus Magnetominusculus xianensis]KWT78226.1 asparagine synthetase B [Candidatus Magnetominusculus xianensis]MBF0402822.1 asparagine synthase (glutamine-hydrolyzing) [Nitrospirota bacterium]